METTLKTIHSLPLVRRVTRALPLSALILAGSMATGLSAHAQSSVTIYGIVDMGLSRNNNGTTPTSRHNGAPASRDTWDMKAGNTSRLGFRGNEDLGGGMYARFHLETRFATDTGALSNANVFWLGRSVVAAGSKTWGEVYAGREYSAAYWVPLVLDPTLWSYVSQMGAAYTYANYTPVPASIEATNIRWANSVGYKSPKLGPVTFELATGLGETTRQDSVSANIQYKQGPVFVGVAYDGLNSRTNLKIIGGSYDFGFVQPMASYSEAEGGVNGDAKSFSVSALFPTGFGRVYASYGSLSPANNQDSKKISGGVQYDLSKRTLLYANVGSAKQVNLSRLTAIDFGIKHTF